jgi:hypothetical protein
MNKKEGKKDRKKERKTELGGNYLNIIARWKKM